MIAIQMFVAPQKLQAIHQMLSADFCRALESLTTKLTDMPGIARSASPREYAELREAKSLVSYLKYPDPTESVRMDEMAWALGRISESYRADQHEEWVSLFETAARMLGIDLTQQHPIPADLNRRISNEMLLLRPVQAPVAMASAV